MSRAVLLTGAGLVALGLAIFSWKAGRLDLPVTPARAPGLWQVQIEIAARGDGAEGSVRAALPYSGPGQRIFGEHFTSDRLGFEIRSGDEARLGIWSGWMERVHRILYGFRVQLFPREVPVPAAPYAAPPPSLRQRYARPSLGIPSSTEQVREAVQSLRLPGPDGVGARVRSIFAFVTHEIGEGESAGDDAVLTLMQREGSELGRERLLVTLLRGVGIPARLVQGLELRETTPRRRLWTEAWIDGVWVPMSATAGFFAEVPAGMLAVRYGDGPLVEGTGTRAVAVSFTSLQENLSPDDLATLMTPPVPFLQSISLYRLPLQLQASLRLLLLLPLGVLLLAVARNALGVPSYGTFMPVLVALALRWTGLGWGLVMLLSVLAVGVLGRLVTDRLRLLLVPRLSLLLCVVVLVTTAIALLGKGMDQSDLYAGVLFPIVILTMLIERMSIVLAEEGTRAAVVRFLWSSLLAISIYPLFRSELLAHLMFTFPELIFVSMGCLVWLGGYTGYRVSDLIRFRSFASGAA